MVGCIKNYWKRIIKLQKHFVVFLLIFSLLLSQFSFLVPSVYAASTPWEQTDWSGGVGTSTTNQYSSASNITDSTTGQVTLSPTSGWCSNASCDATWKYRKKVTFNNTDANLGVTSENLVNFPVLVKLSSSNIDYSKTQDSGQDIRFTDTDGTDLSYEIEKWDETGTSFVWVKVPQIDINSSTDYVYLYYGNTSATDHQQVTSVWNSNYVMVQHLADTSGTNTNDSTSNNNDGTKVSATEPNPTTSGQVNGAQNFDGNNDAITTLSTSDAFNAGFQQGINTDGTFIAWIKTSDYTINLLQPIISSSDGFSNIYGISFEYDSRAGSSNRLAWKIGKGTSGSFRQHCYTLNALGDNNWHQVAASVTSSGAKFFKDGVLLENVSCSASGTTTTTTTSFPFTIAGNGSSTFRFGGIIDEVRVSNAARSAAWVAASYKSETDAFNAYNTEEESYVSSGTLASSIFDTEQQSNWGTLTYNTDGVATTAVKVRTSNSSTMTGATDFASCNAITSGTDISSSNCVTDTHRYIQYQISLTPVSSDTPTFQDISIGFTASDSTPPEISLTALTPDPNTDTTPTISGIATDAVGTVSAVQFQIDSTSGTWSSCTADDSVFDEASETFTCTSTSLSDGSHTMYVRATDSNGNTTGSGSESSDSFTIDATTPISVDLDSPSLNSYTNNERPTFKWKATTDETAGLSKYVLEIDNPSLGSGQPSGDFSIDNIPTSGTEDVINNRYVIHFENFSDSDATNNYISVYTRSSSEWSTDSNSGQNDGKLREGIVHWTVKAVDNVGNETSSSRTIFVDRTNPKVEFTQVNESPFSSTNFSTTDKTPTIYGKITDQLAGGNSSQTQDDNGPKIASGPKQVDIKVEKKEGLGYKLHTLYTINMDKPWYACDGKEVSDNSKQKCDKYLPFEYTPKDVLELGTYKITLTGKDKADNSSSETSFTLNVTTLSRITTPEEKETIEEEIKELPKEEQEKVKQELEITKPVEPSALEKAQTQISQSSKNTLNAIGKFISAVFNGIGQGVRFAFNITGKALAFVGDKTGQTLAFIGRTVSNTAKTTGNALMALYNGATSILAYVGQGIGNGAMAASQGLAWTGGKVGQGVSYLVHGTGNFIVSIGQGIGNTGRAIGGGYNQLAQNAPGVTKTILTGIGSGVSTTGSVIASVVKYTTDTTVIIAQGTGNFITEIANNIGKTTSSIAQNTSKTIGNIANSVASTTSSAVKNTGSAIASATNYVIVGTTTFTKNAGLAIASTTQNGVNNTKNGIANLAFAIGERTEDISHGVGTTIIKIGYLFVSEPTTISNVKVAKSTATTMTVTWETNHPANGKVNYGLTADYGQDVQSEKRITSHEFTVSGLEPNTTYHYEVMSHNRNYVYDANHTFTTPAE